jgi:O-antigen ligase
VLMGILAHDMFWERMGTIEAAAERDEAADTSALSRFALVDAQFRMFKSYPHGTGHRGTATLSPRYLDERFLSGGPDESQERRRSSHNTFMTALTEQGIPGAIFYVWVWSWCALTALRLKRNQAFVADPQRAALLASVAAGLVIVLVAGVFVDYIKAEVQIWLSALLASLAALAAQPAAEPTTAMAANSAARPPPVQIGDRGEAIRPAGRK